MVRIKIKAAGVNPVDWKVIAEYMTLPVTTLARKPKSLSFEQAAALPLTGGTALRALDSLGLQPGHVLLIHNGSGGVGQAGIQIAKAAGARVLATSSPKNHDFLATLGAP